MENIEDIIFTEKNNRDEYEYHRTERLDWEYIEGHNERRNGFTMGLSALHRAKVFGGWLVYKNAAYRELKNSSEPGYEDDFNRLANLSFVPDPNHEWDLPPVKEQK